MLTVKVFSGLGRPPVELPANLVIVEDTFGNPLCVACALDNRVTVVEKVSDPNFARVLQSLGLDKVVVNKPLAGPGPPPPGSRLETF